MQQNPQIIALVNSSIFSSGIQCLLDKSAVKILGIAQHWHELFSLLQEMHPDALLIDFQNQKHSGNEYLEKLRAEYPAIPIVLILGEQNGDSLAEFISLGINGFVYNDTFDGLVRSIELVANGHEYFSEGMLNWFMQKLQIKENHLFIKDHHPQLTPREMDVCKLFCSGLSYKQIASTLYISPRTVESHKKNILDKLKIKSTADLVKYAIHNHLI